MPPDWFECLRPGCRDSHYCCSCLCLSAVCSQAFICFGSLKSQPPMPIYSSLWVCCRLEWEMLFLFLSFFLPIRTSSWGYFWGLNIIACTPAPIEHINCLPIKLVLFAWFLSIAVVICLFNVRQVICAGAATDKKCCNLSCFLVSLLSVRGLLYLHPC